MFLSKYVEVREIKTRESEVGEYSVWCLFKCWTMFVVFQDLYYDPTDKD